MSLNKRTYTDNVTVITADNLNEIQDEVIANGTAITNTYTKTETDSAISTAISGLSVPHDINDLTDTQGLISGKEAKGKLTFNGFTFDIVLSSTDAPQEGKIVFYLESP